MSKNAMSLSGKVFKAEPDGSFIVSRAQLRGQDLRALPSDTMIAVRDPRSHRSDPIRIVTIVGPSLSGFEIRCDYWRCPHCWDHALDYDKFMHAAREILIKPNSAGINYDEITGGDDGLYHILHVNRGEYKIEDMEAALEDEIDKILDPLLQFTDQLDQQVRQQFGV